MISTIIAFIGFQEVIFIIFLAVLVFGPDKIPEIARGLGEGVRAMRDATDQIKREVMSSAEKMDPTEELKKSAEDVKKEIDEAKKEIDEAVGPIKRS